jgi:hypothetical protein
LVRCYVWDQLLCLDGDIGVVYREIVPPERIVRTEIFELGCDAQAGEQVATLVLTERGDKTALTLTVVFPSKEARDATIASGMDRLAINGSNSGKIEEAYEPETFKQFKGLPADFAPPVLNSPIAAFLNAPVPAAR